MGNNKFKLSDMIPNAWFYKLKDMSKTRNKTKKKKNNTNTNTNKPNTKKKTLLTPITTNTTKTHPKPHHHLSQPPNNKLDPRFSPTKHHLKPSPDSTIRFPEPPRKSSKRRSTSSRRRKPVFRPHSRFVSSSSTENSSSSESLFPSELDHEKEEEYVDEDEDPFLRLASTTWSSSNCNCRLSSSTADIIIDLDTYDHNRAETTKAKSKNNNKKINNPFKDDVVSELDLPPILTKPINFDDTIFKATKKHRATTTKNSSSSQPSSVNNNNNNNNNNNHIFARKSSGSNSSSSTGIRLRASSPRLASKKIQACARKSVSSSKQYLSESFAVVKSSIDPQRDFRDSMVEMIVENNIRATRDLEELLACYLSLNSKEYHDVIVKAFEQIWFDMADIRL